MMNSILGNVITSMDTSGAVPVNTSEFGKYILGLHYSSIGNDVREIGRIGDDTLTNIVAFCRRRIKKLDIILIDILDEEGEGTDGIAFTEDRILWWENEGIDVNEIFYKDITGVDFGEEYVIIKHNNETTNISLREDAEEEKYSRYMYNFIMDILEYDATQQVEPQIVQKKKSGTDDYTDITNYIGEKIKAYEQGKTTIDEVLDSIGNALRTESQEGKISNQIMLGIMREVLNYQTEKKNI